MPMQPKVFELGQWTPDAPELSADGVVVARNCVPTRYGYGPFGEYAVETDDLDDRARGAILSRDDTDAVFSMPVTRQKLYSRAAEPGQTSRRSAANVADTGQLGVPALAQSVFATNYTDNPQIDRAGRSHLRRPDDGTTHQALGSGALVRHGGLDRGRV